MLNNTERRGPRGIAGAIVLAGLLAGSGAVLPAGGSHAQEASESDSSVPASLADCFEDDLPIEVTGGRLVGNVRLGVSRGGTIAGGGTRLMVAESGDDLVARSEEVRVGQWKGRLSNTAASEDHEGCIVMEYTGPAYEAGEDSNCRFSADGAMCPDACSLYDGAWKVICRDDDPNVLASGGWTLE